MKRLVPFAMLIAMLLSALPLNAAHAAIPAPVVDQEFVTPADASLSFPDGPNNYIAQTFTAGVTGLLTAVNLDFTTPSLVGGEMSLEIVGVTNGLPDSTMFSQRFLTQDDLQAMNAGPLSYTIPVPSFVVTAGTQYAISVHYTSAPSGSTVQSVWSGATGNHYSGGSVFTGTSFESWTPAAAGLDLHFRTYVVTGPVSDLKITLVRAPGKAHACQTFTMVYRVTNHGPDTARGVSLGMNVWDQFDVISINGTRVGTPHPTFTLKKGQSVLMTVRIKVTGFVPGESRKGLVTAWAWSDRTDTIPIDPNPDNNSRDHFVWMDGRPRESCP
jgi:hypothetical protein